MFKSGKDTSAILGVSQNTLRKMADEGLINTYRTDGGQRRYNVNEYLTRLGSESVIAYCRVSSAKQKDDLDRQVAAVKDVYPTAEVIKDIGSGLNFKRKGLLSILDRLMRGDKLTIVLTYRDRLCGFGFDLINYLVERNSGKIVVLNRQEDSPERELVEDVVSVIDGFSCRFHGSRNHASKKNRGKANKEPDVGVQEVDGCV